MNICRVAALSISFLLGLGAVTAANAHPWHETQVSGDKTPAPAPHVMPAVHVVPEPNDGLRRPIPVVAPQVAAHVAPRNPYHGDWDHDWDRRHWDHDWGHGDIRFFYHYDWDDWHGGYWRHGWYGPRFGWWWVVSGVWFFYPMSVYPYPDPYVPSEWAAPPPPTGAAVPAAGSYWYFCPASNAYYPYVPSCPSGWQQVPAQPAGQAQPAAAPATAPPPPPADGPPGG